MGPVNAKSTTGAVVRPARVLEWDACRELVERVFGDEVRIFDLLTRVDPEHRPDYVRIVDVEGRPVSILVLVPRRILLAGVPVDGAIVTLVGTDPGYRGRGLARLLLDDTVSFLRARGFRLGMLYGIPDLYPKFGFVPCLGNYTTTFSPARAAAAPRQSVSPAVPPVWRPATDQDAPGLAALYAQTTAGTPCTVVRPDDKWVWSEPARPGAGLTVLQGEPLRAYVRWSVESGGLALAVPEVGALTPSDLLEAVRWTAAKATELGLETVRFAGPPDHPFARAVYLAAGAEMVIRPARAGQVIVANRGLLMADLVPALTRRAEAAGLPRGAQLVFDVGSKRFDLLFTATGLRLLGGRAGRQAEQPVSRLPAEALTLLLTGYAAGAEVEGMPGTSVAPAHRAVLAALFPRSYPKWIPAPYWGE